MLLVSEPTKKHVLTILAIKTKIWLNDMLLLLLLLWLPDPFRGMGAWRKTM